ncbi:hypothetical protein [Photobacterium lutimaris]|uniref:Uncharacterized protein n=1 Tax=Photobacterium lutimaris TaxID=388278 RepID=A0A2T3ITS8_9GAMM|nr:hypothetical protein [Photobacterium lutimaris]PSU31753.1 hypothetical protein C9I99_21455 [Photobacterium lutimaris]TDR72597.1 hypothetical protein DFP78_11373 [Photobacterium lutimaris]
MIRIDKVRRIGDETGQQLLRVRNSHISKRDGLFTRLAPIKVLNEENNKWVIRNVRGSGIKAYSKSEAGLDYDAFAALGVPYSAKAYKPNISLKRATMIDLLIWLWREPNPGAQLGFKISIVSLVLAIISMFF